MSIYKIKNIKRISYNRNYSSYLSFKYPNYNPMSHSENEKIEIKNIMTNTNSRSRKSIFCKICGEIIGSAGSNHVCDIINS